MRRICVSLCALVLLALPIALVAQDAAPMGPPKVIQIVREEVKPGKGAAHEKWEASWTQAMVRAKFTTPQLAMTAVTGNNEAWYISGYDSFGALEAVGLEQRLTCDCLDLNAGQTAKFCLSKGGGVNFDVHGIQDCIEYFLANLPAGASAPSDFACVGLIGRNWRAPDLTDAHPRNAASSTRHNSPH